jgi:phage/plasmid primase-like uncharacterized protein/RecA-family ATPase
VADITGLFGGKKFDPALYNIDQPVTDPVHDFMSALEEHGLVIENLDTTGKLTRVRTTDDKMSQKSGWYVYYDDVDCPAGAYGSWKTGEQHNWCKHDLGLLDESIRDAYKARMIQAKVVREKAKDKEHKKAAKEANKIWRGSEVVDPNNKYLEGKGVDIHGIRQVSDGRIIVPVTDHKGDTTSLQFISPDGSKRFLTGGKISGGFHSIGKLTQTIFLCEGYATGATIHEATGSFVIVAFNAHNLGPVAAHLRKLYPENHIVVAGDDDRTNEENTGRLAAEKAASDIGGVAVFPDFGDCADGTDFNDLAAVMGTNMVAAQLSKETPTSELDETLHSMGEFVGKKAPEQEWILDPIIPRGEVTLLSSRGGVGKTTIAQMMMTCVYTGQPFFGTKVTKGKVLALFCEDGIANIQRRQESINEQYGITMDDVAGIGFDARQGAACEFMTWERIGAPGAKTSYWNAINALVKQTKPDFIVIDTAIDTYGDNVNDPARVRKYIRECLNQIASENNCAILLLGHTSKSTPKNPSEFMGTEAWNNTVRSRMFMENNEGSPKITMSLKKSNYASTDWELELYRDSEGVLSNRIDSSWASQLKEDGCDRVFLAQVDSFYNDRAQNISLSPGNNYAPKAIFTVMKSNKKLKYTVSDYEDSMNRLFEEGQIKTIRGLHKSSGKTLIINPDYLPPEGT